MVVDPKKLFFPNKAIRQDNKAFFAGRRDLLLKACNRVGRDDFSAVVYGDRGVGKTSFGWQLLELLSGDHTLLEQSNQSGDPISISHLPSCKCIWLQCQDYMENIEGVLLTLLKESARHHSLSTEFPRIYQDKEFNQKIEQKYKVTLGVVSAEFLLTGNEGSGSSRQSSLEQVKSHRSHIQDLFKEVIDACKQLSEDEPIVVFLDEFDSLPDRSGMGQLIKATDDVRFVIIGIADNVDEIIEDHQSADRKFADSKFRIPRLEPQEVHFIFDKAQEVAEGKLIFNHQFREEAIFRSYGYPFLIQQFGYFATWAALEPVNQDKPLQVGFNHLREAIDRLFKDKADNKLFKPLIETLQGDGQARKEILRIVADSSDRILISNIRDQIGGRLRQHVENNADKLVEARILKRSEDDRLRFRDPEARILTQLHFQAEELRNQ